MNNLSPFPRFTGPEPQVFTVGGMSCGHCQARVEGAALAVPGVHAARVDLTAGTLTTEGGDPAAICAAVAAAGYAIEVPLKAPLPLAPVQRPTGQGSEDEADTYQLQLTGLHCASCVARVETVIRALPGVHGAAVNLVEQMAQVTGGDPAQVRLAVQEAGYGATLVLPAAAAAEEDDFELDITGMRCASCVARVEAALRALPGVRSAAVHLVEQKALVQGGSAAAAATAVAALGFAATPRIKARPGVFFLRLGGSSEDLGLAQIRDILQAGDGAATVAAEGERLRVATSLHPADVLLRLAETGASVELEEAYADPALAQAEESRREIRRTWGRAILAGVVGASLMAGHMSGLLPHLHQARGLWAGLALLCLLTMVLSGRQYFIGAWTQARHRAANMDTLVALGTGAAWLSSVLVIAAPEFFPGGGERLYLDASVMILAFLQLGHALETRAKRTTSEAISALVGLRARTALVLRPAGAVEIPVSLLRLGDRVRVKPGEKVPIDGEIIEGQTTLDESMLTGEPLAVARQAGDTVTGGTMNRTGVFVLAVTRLGEDTTLARIIRLVKTAQLSKPPIGRLVDRIAGVFVPVVLGISLITLLVWLGLGPEPRLAHALTTAIAVLVIACPCSLGLATPIAIMVGTSRAAECHILIRNSDALQTASTLTHVVVDKTGTLTQGRPAVTAILPAAGTCAEEVLLWAAALESGSEHPLAEAVLAAQQQSGVPLPRMEQFTAVPGRGVRAVCEATDYLLGNDHYLAEQGLVLPLDLTSRAREEAASGGTPVWLARGGEVLGLLILKDPVRPDAAAAVRALQAQGLTVLLCTGDNRATAEAVAREVGIATVHSEILPEGKLEVIRALQALGHRVGMVGDGVNDAPALAQAETGFAIGSGTDVAIENADITLTGDSLLLVATAIAISKATLRNIKQNLFGAFVYNVIGIPLAAGLFYPFTGWLLEPMFASAAMALSSVTVVTNANRLRWFKP